MTCADDSEWRKMFGKICDFALDCEYQGTFKQCQVQIKKSEGLLFKCKRCTLLILQHSLKNLINDPAVRIRGESRYSEKQEVGGAGGLPLRLSCLM